MNFSLSGKVIDFYDDIDGEYVKPHIAKLGSVTVTPPDELLNHPDSSFSLKIITKLGHEARKYPVATPGDTVLSLLYFEKTAEKLPDEAKSVAATFLKKASSKWNIPCPDIVGKHAADFTSIDVYEDKLEAPSSPNDIPCEFALTTKTGEQMYPINNVDNIQRSIEYFDDNYRLLEPVYRNKMATAIHKKAPELGVKIASESPINDYANGDYSPLTGCHIGDRREFLQHDEESLNIFNSLLEKRGSLMPIEFAEVLENFDRISGLDKYWDASLADPYKTTFQRVKTASKEVNYRGKVITESDLSGMATNEKVASHFDKHFFKDLQGDPIAVFESLPTPEKDLIASFIGESV